MNGTSPRIRITVTCHACHERLMVAAQPYERKLKCPECGGTIRVAAYNAVEEEFRRRLAEPRNVDPGVYQLAGRGGPQEPAEQVLSRETIAIKCPCCQSLLHPEVRDEEWFDTCPDCLEQFRVPPRSEIPKKLVPLPIPDPGQYEKGTVTAKVGLTTEVFDRIAAIKEVELDPPPKWTFFSQVYLYPWSKHVWPRWIWMSIGWCISWSLVNLVIYFIMLGGLSPIAAAFFALPAFWFSFMTLSYSAANSLTVLEGTAAGRQNIDEWPEPDWREWAANLLYLTFIGVVALGISSLLTYVLALPGLEWYLSVGLIHVLYPIVLLSALETTNPFWPVSRPVLHSMVSHARFWLLYYLISCTISVLYLLLVLISMFSLTFLSVLWTGPLTAAMLLLQARLLGRLGWRTVVEPDGGAARLRKMARIKNWKETPIGKFEPIPPESTSL